MALMLKTASSRMKWAIGSAIAVVLVALGATATYAVSFAEKALPGVSIAGQSITGMTRDEAIAAVRDRADKASVTFTVDGQTTTTSLADAGVTVDAEKTVDEAFAANANLGGQLKALFSPTDVTPVVTTDEAALSAFASTLAETTGAAAKEAEVTLAEDGASFVSTESAAGAQIDVADVKKAISSAAQSLASSTSELTTSEVTPTVTTEAAKAEADAANALVALDVTISDGVDSYTAEATEKASWVTIPKNEDGTLGAPTLDKEKVAAWVTATAEKTNVEVVNGINNVNSKGEVLTVAKKGVSGWTANNADAVTDALVSAVDSGQAYSGEFTYDEVKPTYETRTIAEGAENLVYQAAPGEKWIDANLSTNTVTAYEGATVVGGPFYVVPGAPATPTVTGTYHVYLKYETQTMRGENVDGSKYETPNVPWVTYWTGSYAFHGAPWRSSFGWSGPGGSHGCINMPVSAAKFIYDWSEIGTTVVSHY